MLVATKPSAFIGIIRNHGIEGCGGVLRRAGERIEHPVNASSIVDRVQVQRRHSRAHEALARIFARKEVARRPVAEHGGKLDKSDAFDLLHFIDGALIGAKAAIHESAETAWIGAEKRRDVPSGGATILAAASVSSGSTLAGGGTAYPK